MREIIFGGQILTPQPIPPGNNNAILTAISDAHKQYRRGETVTVTVPHSQPVEWPWKRKRGWQEVEAIRQRQARRS